MAKWYDHKGLVPIRPKLAPLDPPGTYDRNKTYIVTTIEEAPYMMRNYPDAPEGGDSEPYRGYCADLVDLIADKLEIKCKSSKFQLIMHGPVKPKY